MKTIDVRTKEEFESGHIAGSTHIPLDALEATLAMSPEKIGEKDDAIVLVCRSGGRAGMALEILKNAGYTNVKNGGAWNA
jgi:phage shock protein E